MSLHSVLLLQEKFEFADNLEVLRASGRSLCLDQLLKADAQTSYSEEFRFEGGWAYIFIPAHARHFTKQIQWPERSDQSVVEPPFQCPLIKPKRQARGSRGDRARRE